MAKLPVDANVKRGSWAVSAVLAAVVMTVPLLVIILSGSSNSGAPGIWIQTAVAGLRKGQEVLLIRCVRTYVN